MANNEQVGQAWAKGRAASAGHLSTDGQTLKSYWHVIGETTGDQRVALCCHYSQTTAHHCSLAKRYADDVVECVHERTHSSHKVRS